MVQRRNTLQRLRVKEAIDVLGHPTSDELILYMNKTHPDVSLATIYRNLSILLEDGAVIKLNLGNSNFYEAVKEKHYHFVCRECNNIIDIPLDKMNEIMIPKEIMDNQSVDHDFVFFGYCKNCKKNII
jgi:Fe2+ or Zn2+ uptake regulation protein